MASFLRYQLGGPEVSVNVQEYARSAASCIRGTICRLLPLIAFGPNFMCGHAQYSGPNQKIGDQIHMQLCDIHEERLRRMDENGVEFQVLSFVGPFLVSLPVYIEEIG